MASQVSETGAHRALPSPQCRCLHPPLPLGPSLALGSAAGAWGRVWLSGEAPVWALRVPASGSTPSAFELASSCSG